MHGHPCTHSTVPVTPQSHLTATQSPGRGALHKQLQLTMDLISEALMSLIEIFFFFFFLPPGRRRWQNLFHGKFQFLFPIWKTNGIISLRKKEKKKKLPKVARSPWEAERSFHPAPGQLLAPGKRPCTDGLCAGMDQTLSQTVSPTIHLC